MLPRRRKQRKNDWPKKRCVSKQEMTLVVLSSSCVVWACAQLLGEQNSDEEDEDLEQQIEKMMKGSGAQRSDAGAEDKPAAIAAGGTQLARPTGDGMCWCAVCGKPSGAITQPSLVLGAQGRRRQRHC